MGGTKEANGAVQMMLTDREAEIASLVRCGMSNEQIGLVLGLRPGVVANHLTDIYKKLGIRKAGHCPRALLAAMVAREMKERQARVLREMTR